MFRKWFICSLLFCSIVQASPVVTYSSSSVFQGDTVRVDIQTDSLLNQGTIYFNREKYTLFNNPNFDGDGYGYMAYVGVSRFTRPDAYVSTISLLFQDGSTFTKTDSLKVLDASFPRSVITLPAEKSKIVDRPSYLSSEAAIIGKAFKTITRKRYFSKPFILPTTGSITTQFGAYRITNGKESGRHSGTDIGNIEGTPVVASNRGRVILTEPFVYHGNTVMIDHGMGIISIYNHLSRIDVSPDQFVEQGQRIGLMGSTGVATGPHVHWGIGVQNVRINPVYWVEHPYLLE